MKIEENYHDDEDSNLVSFDGGVSDENGDLIDKVGEMQVNYSPSKRKKKCVTFKRRMARARRRLLEEKRNQEQGAIWRAQRLQDEEDDFRLYTGALHNRRDTFVRAR